MDDTGAFCYKIFFDFEKGQNYRWNILLKIDLSTSTSFGSNAPNFLIINRFSIVACLPSRIYDSARRPPFANQVSYNLFQWCILEW